MRRRRSERRAGGDLAGPAHDERHADAAFVKAALAAAQRGVVGDAVARLVGRRRRLALGGSRLADQPVRPAVTADAAVVAREDEHGVVGELQLRQFGHHPADAFVDAREHRGVGGAVMPPDAGLGLELGDQPGFGLERRVHAEVGQVQQERLILVALDEVDGLVRQEVRQVLALRVGRLGRRLKIEMAPRGLDGFVEAALRRVVFGRIAQMPLPEHRGRITRLLELVGEGVALEGELGDVVDRAQRPRPPVEAVDAADGVGAGAGAVLAGEEGRSRRRAVLAMVVVGQPHALRGEPVDVRRFVIPAPEATEVGPAEVVGQHEDDVRRPVRGGERPEEAEDEQTEEGADGIHGQGENPVRAAKLPAVRSRSRCRPLSARAARR